MPGGRRATAGAASARIHRGLSGMERCDDRAALLELFPGLRRRAQPGVQNTWSTQASIGAETCRRSRRPCSDWVTRRCSWPTSARLLLQHSVCARWPGTTPLTRTSVDVTGSPSPPHIFRGPTSAESGSRRSVPSHRRRAPATASSSSIAASPQSKRHSPTRAADIPLDWRHRGLAVACPSVGSLPGPVYSGGMFRDAASRHLAGGDCRDASPEPHL